MAAFSQVRGEALHKSREEVENGTPRAKSSDPTRRITIPAPRTLNELQYAARHHFGQAVPGRHTLHHYGKPVMQERHVDQFQHDDVIIVSGEELQQRQEAAVSTHHTDYVKPQLDVRTSCKHPTIPIEYQRFEAQSCYKQDYLKHQARPPRESAKPVKSAWYRGSEEGTGQTTYKTQYTWHSGVPSKPIRSDAFARDFGAAKFEGVSSYRADYIKQPLRPRSAAACPQKDRGAQWSGDFNGVTTYNNDYTKHPLVAHGNTGGTAHKSSLEPSGLPFSGQSEHRREFVPLSSERRHLIHLEPEVKAPKARPGSAPAGSRRMRAT